MYPLTSNFSNFIPSFLIGLGLIVLIALIIRELITWYWKINKIVSLLEKIEENTKKEEKKEEIQKVVE